MIVVGFFLVMYLLVLLLLSIGFYRLKNFQIPSDAPLNPIFFSIVIPVRNEETNLPALFNSLLQLEYPKNAFEVVFVNDHSEDNTVECITQFMASTTLQLHLLHNEEEETSKKASLTKGIHAAKGEWVVSSDGDCILPIQWLKTYNAYIHLHRPSMICGPVFYTSNKSWLEKFQQWDNLSLQLVTIGSFGLIRPIMANGANLAFLKSEFFLLKGYEGNEAILSGDDIFLMEKFRKQRPGKLQYLKSNEVVVVTNPQRTFSSLLDQRIRWASKTSKQKNTFSFLIALIVMGVNLSVLATPVIFLVEGNPSLLLLVPLKFIGDYVFLQQGKQVFKQAPRIKGFVVAVVFYPFFLALIFLFSPFKKTFWKGRKI